MPFSSNSTKETHWNSKYVITKTFGEERPNRIPDLANMPYIDELDARQELLKLQNSGLNDHQMNIFVHKLGYQQIGYDWLAYRRRDGTRILYLMAGIVRMERHPKRRAQIVLPSPDKLRNLHFQIWMHDITIIPILIQWKCKNNPVMESGLTNQDGHSGLLVIRGTVARYFDAHLIKHGPLKRHCEYSMLSRNLPRIISKIWRPALHDWGYCRFKRDSPLTNSCMFLVLWNIYQLTLESRPQMGGLLDPTTNNAMFLDFVHTVIRRVGGVGDLEVLYQYPEWETCIEIPQFAHYDRRKPPKFRNRVKKLKKTHPTPRKTIVCQRSRKNDYNAK